MPRRPFVSLPWGVRWPRLAVPSTPPPPPTDAVTTAWVAALTAAGTGASADEITAVNQFIYTLKNDGLGTWTQIVSGGLGRLNLFLGNDLTACLIPLLRGAGSASDANTAFLAADYTPTTGLQADGTTKFLNTGLPATTFTTSSLTLAAWVAAKLGSASAGLVSSIGVGTANPCRLLYSTATNIAMRSGSNALVANVTVPSNTGGLITGTAITGTDLVSAQNTTVGTTQTGNRAAVAHSANALYVFAENANGTAGAFLNARLFGYSATLGLTAAQRASYYAAWAYLNTFLGRS